MKNNFPNTLKELYYYIEELEDDLGEEIELDVIGLCCDFEEVHIEDLAEEYNATKERTIEVVEQHTNTLTNAGYFVIHTVYLEDIRNELEKEEDTE